MAAKRRQYVVIHSRGQSKTHSATAEWRETSSRLCQAHKLNPNVLNRWRKEFLEQASSIFERSNFCSEDEQKIAEERLVGQLTIQLKILIP